MKLNSFFKRHWLVLFLFFIALIGTYFYFFAPPTKPPVITVPTLTPGAVAPVTSLPPIKSGFGQTSQFIWRLDSLPIPQSLPVIHIAGPSSDPNSYSVLASTLGITTQPTKIPNQPIFIWNASDNSSSFYVNLKDRVASYSLTQDASTVPTIGQKVNPNNITNNLIDLLSPVLNLTGDLSLTKGDTKFLAIDSERYVPISQNQATFVEISLNYAFRGLVVTYRGIPAVKARYSLYGPLVHLSLSLPFGNINVSPDYSLKTFAEIKETPADQFEIISESGSRAFELSDKEEVLRSVIITGGYVGYLINPTSSAVAPYVFLTGTSTSNRYGQINVTLTTPALKLTPTQP